MLGDYLRDLRKRAGLVTRLPGDARREAPRSGLFVVPAHVQPAFRLVLKLGERWGMDRINRDALTRRYNADDTIARHRAAIGRKAHRQIAVDAADRDRWPRRVRDPELH